MLLRARMLPLSGPDARTTMTRQDAKQELAQLACTAVFNEQQEQWLQHAIQNHSQNKGAISAKVTWLLHVQNVHALRVNSIHCYAQATMPQTCPNKLTIHCSHAHNSLLVVALFETSQEIPTAGTTSSRRWHSTEPDWIDLYNSTN